MLAIDFDDTLNFSKKNNDSFEPNIGLVNILKDNKFFILTARNETPENIIRIKEFVIEFDISPEKIIFTNNKEKGPFLARLSKNYDISVLVDDKEYQRDSAEKHGFIGKSPEKFIEEYGEKINKVSRYKKIHKMWKEV